MKTVITGLLIPFIGTAAGTACVFFLRKDLKRSVQRALTSFAAGVMVAASIWSLITLAEGRIPCAVAVMRNVRMKVPGANIY